jgi:hypothetical protein
MGELVSATNRFPEGMRLLSFALMDNPEAFRSHMLSQFKRTWAFEIGKDRFPTDEGIVEFLLYMFDSLYMRCVIVSPEASGRKTYFSSLSKFFADEEMIMRLKWDLSPELRSNSLVLSSWYSLGSITVEKVIRAGVPTAISSKLMVKANLEYLLRSEIRLCVIVLLPDLIHESIVRKYAESTGKLLGEALADMNEERRMLKLLYSNGEFLTFRSALESLESTILRSKVDP